MLFFMDLDGTILNDMKRLSNTFFTYIKKERNEDLDKKTVIKWFYSTGGKSIEYQVKPFINSNIDLISKKISVHFVNDRRKSFLFKDVKPFLKKYFRKFQFILLTGVRTTVAKYFLDYFNIKKYFKKIYGKDKGKKEEILKKYSKIRKVIYVGDSVEDSKLANKNVIVFIRRNDVLKIKAKENLYIINTLFDIPKILKNKQC